MSDKETKAKIDAQIKELRKMQNSVNNNNTTPVSDNIPKISTNDFDRVMSKETDPDLMTIYEIIDLPSKGLFYPNGLNQLSVEYMTSRDEDLLTTPSLIENLSVIDLLLKRKIKTPNVNVEDLLPGDRDAIILFLRTSSYGHEYSVQVTDPRNGNIFKSAVDLTRLKNKEMKELPDSAGHFVVEIPMRKKLVKIRLLTSGEETTLYKKAEAIKEAYGQDFSDFNTMKLKAHIVAIEDKTDRTYIDKFVDAMPALDAVIIRRKVQEVSPEIDMTYEFTTSDGYKFKTQMKVGIDFFSPTI